MAVTFTFSWDGESGYVVVRRGKHGTKLGTLEFFADKCGCLCISSLDVGEAFQRRGFGYIMVGMVKDLAREERKPITLFSSDTAVRFYRKCGFKSQTDSHHDVRVVFDGDTFKTCQNMYFLPDTLRRRKKIHVSF